MAESLCSVGLDVGTTTTQIIFSRLQVENRASSLAVPDLAITERRILYASPVHVTPLLDESHVDGAALQRLVAEEYKKAGIDRACVDTGAIIITGESSRKENARTVMENLASFAGEFVVTTAGPDLESILAARGAGAAAYSEASGKRVLHMDIGGGTSNLALIEDGKIIKTGCLNVGGRLLKMDAEGMITYVSPVLQGLTSLQTGDRLTAAQAEQVAGMLTEALEMAAGLRSSTELLQKLMTREARGDWQCSGQAVISFSGGVAECIRKDFPFLAFGDLGPELGRAIRGSLLCRGEYVLGRETIRATVIGAGCHSAQLSGSTVFYRNIRFPLKNLPVETVSPEQQMDSAVLAQKRKGRDGELTVLAMPGLQAPDYGRVQAMARAIAEAFQDAPVLLCLQQDMAKALGNALALLLPEGTPCLCMDGLKLQPDSYLDVGEPVGPALPVVIKTLILSV